MEQNNQGAAEPVAPTAQGEAPVEAPAQTGAAQTQTNAAPATEVKPAAVAQPGVKSSLVAGLLGIFLGGVGAHNWYLGQKKEGILHCSIIGGVIVLILLSALMNAFSFATIAPILGVFGMVFGIVAGVASLANYAWGLIDGIMILTKGDAGLKARGYVVAEPSAEKPQNSGAQQTAAQTAVAEQNPAPDGANTQAAQPEASKPIAGAAPAAQTAAEPPAATGTTEGNAPTATA